MLVFLGIPDNTIWLDTSILMSAAQFVHGNKSTWFRKNKSTGLRLHLQSCSLSGTNQALPFFHIIASRNEEHASTLFLWRVHGISIVSTLCGSPRICILCRIRKALLFQPFTLFVILRNVDALDLENYRPCAVTTAGDHWQSSVIGAFEVVR